MHLSRRTAFAGAAPLSSSDNLWVSVLPGIYNRSCGLPILFRMASAARLLQHSRHLRFNRRYRSLDWTARTVLAQAPPRHGNRRFEAGRDGRFIPRVAFPDESHRNAAVVLAGNGGDGPSTSYSPGRS